MFDIFDKCLIFTFILRATKPIIIIIYYYPIIGVGLSLENTGEGGGSLSFEGENQKYVIKFISRKMYFSSSSQHVPPIKVITVTQL